MFFYSGALAMSHSPFYRTTCLSRRLSACLSKPNTIYPNQFGVVLQTQRDLNRIFTVRKITKLTSSILITLFVGPFAFAETTYPQTTYSQTTYSQTTDEQPNRSEQMTIFATGTARDTFALPMQVSVIENRPEQSLNQQAKDLLKLQTGIQLSGTERANGQTISMRGYDKRGVLVQVDGVKQGTDTGHIDGIFLDSSLIKRVEVVRGANALLYGSGALGGVIAYQTVDASDLLREGENIGMMHFIQGATGDNSIGSGAALYGRTEKIDALIAGTLRERGNLKQAEFDSPNDETIGNLLAKINWYIDPAQKLSLQTRYYHNDAEQPKEPQQKPLSNGSSVSLDELSANLADRRTRQRDVQLTYHLKPLEQNWLDLTILGYDRKININQTPLSQNVAPIQEKREQTTRGIKLENKSQLDPQWLAVHQFTYGSEYSRQDQKPNAVIRNVFPDAKIDFKSLWLQDELTLTDLPVSFILGTRYDDYHAKNPIYEDVKADKWSSRAALSITPADWLMLFASYSQAFRAPTLGEIYNHSKHFAMGPFYTNNWVPNPNLKPESNYSTELGFGLRFNDLLLERDEFTFKTSYFDTRARDYITTQVDLNFSKPPFPFPPNMPWGAGTTTSANIARATITGWDAEFNYATPYFDWMINYSSIRGKDDQTQEWIDALQPDAISTRISIPISDSGFNLAWQGRFVDAAKRVKSTTKPQAGYGVNDVYLTYENQDILPNIALGLGLDNAFNKAYFSPQGIPQAKRSAQFKASYRF